MNMRATLAATAALNSFSDFLIYLYEFLLTLRSASNDHRRPAEPLWNLRLPAKQRVGLSLLFAMSLLVCLAGALRLYYLEAFYDSVDELCK
jgi:predicted ferric reductase